MSTIALKVDTKGRIVLPLAIRKSMHINAGDVLFFREEETGIHLSKAENPFDILIDDAIEQHNEGKTIGLREFAKKHGIKL
jgi:AbrB family looped-hinge helix DNA binding protein